MNHLTVIVPIIFVALLLSVVIRQLFLNRLSRQLYDAAYVKKDKELFELLIGSPQAKMVMSNVSREIMLLNFYLSIDDEACVTDTVQKLMKQRTNLKEAQTIYPASIGYLCEKGNPATLDVLNDLKKKYADSKDLNMLLMIYDCELACDVYIRKDKGRISDLEELLKADIDLNSRAIYQYRLAKLYDYDGNREKARQLLAEARSNTQDKNAKKKIDKILQGDWDLL